MWGANWIEKAKAAAAAVDAQLNESVGMETPAANAPASTNSVTDNDGSNVWNDDDFKFDDDDDEVENQQQKEVPDPTSDEKVPASAEGQEAPKEAAALSAVSEPEPGSRETPQPLPEATKEADVTNNAWEAEDDNQDFDNFDGVSPTEPAPETAEQQQPTQAPTTPQGGGLRIGGLSLGRLGGKIKIPSKVNEINFMSPLSTVMTSISHDQEREQTQEHQPPPPPDEEEEADQDIPLTPMKEAAPPLKSFDESAPPKVDEDISRNAEDAGAWQEEDDIQFDEEFSEVNPPEDDPDKEQSTTVEKEQVVAAPDKPNEKQDQEEKKSSEEGVKTNEEADRAAEAGEPEPAEGAKSSQPAPGETPPKENPPDESAAAAPTGPVVSSAELEQVKSMLAQREEQLAAKAEQMFQLQQMYEKEKQDLIKKVENTKEEAKKRIMKARERCEQAENKLQASTSALTDDAAQQAQLVAALREEGQKLALKQSEMEKTVRAARGEARELKEQLDEEMTAKENALAKIEKLQADLKSTQEQLSSARKGETQAGKLDSELQAAREEISLKENTIMSMEQTIKELKAENKELTMEVEAAREGAALDNEREIKKLRKDHNAVVADLEAKLQTSEKEAAVREDSLLREVEELRKRWQDAVRRADALSMDVQSSTAPLLRQLESMERQHRARASAAAELETKLRTELEETVIQNEKLTKDHVELKMRYGRVERQSKEQQIDLLERQKNIDELTTKTHRLEEKLQTMQIEGEKKKEEWAEIERLANEGVSKVRSEMSHAVLESEERYRSQLETMKEELRIEQEKRSQLEQQVDQLLENAAVIISSQSNEYAKEAKPKNLRESEGQAEILSCALLGLGGDSHDDDETDDEDLGASKLQHQTSTASSSFAALEHLTQNLKAAKKELETLRKRLAESEKTRESLVEELGESLDAKEKLPLFEAKVKELMADNKEKELEIRGLQDDIADVKEMYRTQMNVLLEEKAAAFEEVAKRSSWNGSSNAAVADPAEEVKEVEEKVPELIEDMF